MKRRDFLKSTAGFAIALSSGQAGSRKPNIIFILASDLGIGGLSCYGSDNFKTPNIDRLAATGIRFTHCYSAPLAGPSRALFLTGRYAFHTGATSQDSAAQLDPSEESLLPAYLKSAGYVTAAIGKWSPLPLTPANFGFDEQSTDDAFIADFLTRHSASPFFVYYAMSQVHGDIKPTPDSTPDSRDLYADNIAYMDKLVGKVVTQLERLKLRDNTLIVFTADNGTGTVYAAESTIGGRRPIGEKGSMQEGGSLVPLVVNWPGTTPAGKVSADLIDSTDFVPTFAALGGAKLPDDDVFDGHSFAPQLLGQKAQPRDWIFIELGKSWYVRDAAWKLNQAGELYDMSHSPFEEPLVPAGAQEAARIRLQAILDQLNPAAGITDDGDGSGRHKGHKIHTRKKKKTT
jgi:arylsulfatase A